MPGLNKMTEAERSKQIRSKIKNEGSCRPKPWHSKNRFFEVQNFSMIQFKAGLCEFKDKIIKPLETEKGTITVKVADDSLAHFTWTRDSQQEAEQDFVVMPGGFFALKQMLNLN